MEERKDYVRNKGGRPVKSVKRNKLIGERCTTTERFIIEAKAKCKQLANKTRVEDSKCLAGR